MKSYLQIKADFQYYFRATYRRKLLDTLQEKYKGLYAGVVLDIGGRSRGRFKKPREAVKKWLFADIEDGIGADMVLDIAYMKDKISDSSIDVLNCIELFEHVKEIELALDESERVLKEGGLFIVSVPFLYPLHGSPSDYQRWTEHKWRYELEKRGLEIIVTEINGRVFTVIGEILRVIIKRIPYPVSIVQYVLHPIVDGLVMLDKLDWIKNHERLGLYHAGYFIIAKKCNNVCD